MKFLKNLFKRKQSIYGARIFEQQSWLDKKVNDEVWKKQFNLPFCNKMGE